VPFDTKPVVRPYEAFVYGNSADEPNKLAEHCLEEIELKSVERVTACFGAQGSNDRRRLQSAKTGTFRLGR
jgi:hypothetical protein